MKGLELFPQELSDQVNLALRRFEQNDGSTAKEICFAVMDRTDLSLADHVVLGHILRECRYEHIALLQYERALRGVSDLLQEAFLHGEQGFCYYATAEKAKTEEDARKADRYYIWARKEFVRACRNMKVVGQLRPLLYLADVFMEQGEFAKAGHIITQYIDSGKYAGELEASDLLSFASHLRGKYVDLTGKTPER